MATIKHEAETGRLRFAAKTSRVGRGPLLPVPQMTEPNAMTRPAYIDGDIDGLIVKPIKAYHDDRGWLIELFRHDELAEPLRAVMAYASMTFPGVARAARASRPNRRLRLLRSVRLSRVRLGPSRKQPDLFASFANRRRRISSRRDLDSAWNRPRLSQRRRSPRPCFQRPQPPLRRLASRRTRRRNPS